MFNPPMSIAYHIPANAEEPTTVVEVYTDTDPYDVEEKFLELVKHTEDKSYYFLFNFETNYYY